MPKDVRIFVRIPADDKAAAEAALKAQGKTISEAVREYLNALVADAK